MEISLVGVPMDPNAVVTQRTIDLLPSDVDLIRSEVVTRPEWGTVLRSLEASVSQPTRVPAPTHTARPLDPDLWAELRDLATRMLDITDELGLHVEARSFKLDVAGPAWGRTLLEPRPADAKFHNPNERAFIAAVRGWAANAAFVDVLLDLAHVARKWESEGGETYRSDDLLRLRDKWMRREDPETYADEIRDRRHRPRVVGT